ncbi:MAG: alcohol dehydrogenase catalytic domain-containing protein, partial [Candidatus Limnocylindrales bacterium]
MTVARLHAPADLRLHDEATPLARDGHALLRITSVGLCGSDRHWFAAGAIGGTTLDAPLVLGHEFAGVIATGPDAGQRVVAEPAIPCRVCSTCRDGRTELCPTAGFAGYGDTDGALRTYATWPAELLSGIPDTIGDDEATLLEPLGIALHAIDLAAVAPGARVAVVGAGPIGQLVIRALQAGVGGAGEVLVKEPLAHRSDAALVAGARPVRLGDEADVAIECAGEDAAVD